MHYIRPENINIKRKGQQRGSSPGDFKPRLYADPPAVYAEKLSRVDWLDYQSTREEREAKAKAERERRAEETKWRFDAIDWSK